MDAFAEFTHRFVQNAQQIAKNATRTAKDQFQELEARSDQERQYLNPLEAGARSLVRNVINVADSVLNRDDYNDAEHTRYTGTTIERAQYELETEKLLQRFIYEQFTQCSIDMPAIDVSYGLISDEFEFNYQNILKDFCKYLLPKDQEAMIEIYAKIQSYCDQHLELSHEQVAQKQDESEIYVILHRIDKDIVRTDRGSPFYIDNEQNTKLLRKLLFYAACYLKEVSYVQGMADLLSPLLYLVMNCDKTWIAQQFTILDGFSDVQCLITFWLFSGFLVGPFDRKIVSTLQTSQDLTPLLSHSTIILSNYKKNQAGMNLRFNLLQQSLKWLDPVLYQHLEDLDNNDSFSTSNPTEPNVGKFEQVDNIRLNQIEDGEWTELQQVDQLSSKFQKPKFDPFNSKLETLKNGGLSFFWFFKSLLLLFKRDVQMSDSIHLENQQNVPIRDQQIETILYVWLEMVKFKMQNHLFPEIFISLAIIESYIRPLIIPTFPCDKPQALRNKYNLQEVDQSLDQIRDRIWQEVIEGGSQYFAQNFQEGMATGEGALELLLRCMNAVSGKIQASVIIRGMHYWYERLQHLVHKLHEQNLLELNEKQQILLNLASVPVFNPELEEETQNKPEEQIVEVKLTPLDIFSLLLMKYKE